jgi:nicotinamide mononucleotide transporter
MAVYGWHQWSNNFDKTEIPELAIIRWTAKQHFAAIGVVLSLTFTSGWLLSEYSTSALPFLESFTAWGAVITTYMVVDKELYLTALLFTAYVVIVCFGFWEWLKHYQKNNA